MRDYEAELIEAVRRFRHDPLGFVLAMFPWGEAGGPLADKTGPDLWQRKALNDIGSALKAGKHLEGAIQEAISSGHGVGKSAFFAWLILWSMSTCGDTRGVITANTENQLRTKTWPELAKWHRMCLCGHWFTFTATALFSKEPGRDKTWRFDAVPWSENNVEAFAGLHNEGRRIVALMDEASAIPDLIWETLEGALTDSNTEILWIAAGNPTRNTGRFRECFGRRKHRWITQQVDSRTVAITNKSQINKWAEDYGEDSDFFRVRVRGLFPMAASSQFISTGIAESAVERDVRVAQWEPVYIGLDVARFGDDESVLCARKGQNARLIPWQIWRGKDTQFVAHEAAKIRRAIGAVAICVDETGLGAGVVDRLRALNEPVVPVNNGSRPTGLIRLSEGVKVKNRGGENWAAMRDWLPNGSIPNDPQLIDELTGREYGYDADGAIILERKEHMKERGLSSPDRADALALTFAQPQAIGRDSAFEDDDHEYDQRRTANSRTGY